MLSKSSKLTLLDRLLSLTEQGPTSDRLLLRLWLVLAVLAGLVFLYQMNARWLEEVPTRGGTITEGIVGIPRFVNPALAIARADQDIVALVYSGLLKIDATGQLVPDLAESIVLSEDGRTYNISVKRDRLFHDGTPVTARDAAFTFELIRNPDLKSPLRGNWVDVTIELVDEYNLTISLPEAYTPFIENFTVGIMPRHIWGNLPVEQLSFSQYNTEPIGAGPFLISRVERDTSGLVSSYILKPDPQNFVTNLAQINLRFFQNEDALISAFANNQINSTAYLPSHVTKNLNTGEYHVISRPLPRVFGIFFNQNRSPALRDQAARKALSVALDRNHLIAELLDGYGVPTFTPIIEEQRGLESNGLDADDLAHATETPEQILIAGGWRQTEAGLWEKRIGSATETLSLTLRTGNSALLEKTANAIANTWRSLGVEVQVEQYEQAGLVQSVIRSRDFQALLFGIDMNRTQDLYPFWHSSQKDDPGLNVAQYTNVSVDQLLERARIIAKPDEQWKLTQEISSKINAENPAIFLFAPAFTYVVHNTLTVDLVAALGKPSDRFMNVTDWYARCGNVWPIFTKD